MTTAVVIVTYNSAAHIDRLLSALTSSTPRPTRIIVVDNGSTDGTEAIVAKYEVDWLPLGRNTGFGTACNRGVESTDADIVVFFNPDTIPEPDWVTHVERGLADPSVGSAMAEIELLGRPGTYNNSGGVLSVLGFAWISEFGTPIAASDELVPVAFPMGAAMAMRRDTFLDVGGFREDLFLYLEDTDLGWRLALNGLRNVRVGGWRVSHDYEFARNEGKFRLLERNRHRLLRTNYRRSTRVLLFPMFVLGDLGVMVTALMQGWLRPKLSAFFDDGGDTTRWQELIASQRTVGDATIVMNMDWGLPKHPDVPRPPGTGLVEAVLGGWVRIVLPVIRWLDRRAGLT